jgi:hypothetical protein
MSKVIRPLTAFKRLNPEYYNKVYLPLLESNSAKGRENEFYLWYGYFKLGIKELDSFFFTTQGDFTNKGTVSEVGRLLLYGWYYNIEDWTKEIGIYIYNAYKKIESNKETFNDLDFAKAVKYIRENVGYYYQNKTELKLYILETFFNNEIQELLPQKPKELIEHDRLIEYIESLRVNQRKKGVDYWINKSEDLEYYLSYLEEILKNYNIDFLSFEDYINKQNINDNEYFDTIERLEKTYNTSKIVNEINISLLSNTKK